MHPAAPPPPPPPAKKKTPVWVWILAGVGGAILLAVIAIVSLGFFVLNKVAEVAQNPAELGKIIAQADPNLEMIDADKEKRVIRVRTKDTGETVTIKLDDLLAGKIKLEREGKDGTDTVELGGKVRLPNWVPKFPDVEPTGIGSARSQKDGEGGIFGFETTVSREKVLAFYRDELKRRGFVVKSEEPSLIMHSEDDKQHASITVMDDTGEKRKVTVAYGEKP